jgi:hypothetical protein
MNGSLRDSYRRDMDTLARYYGLLAAAESAGDHDHAITLLRRADNMRTYLSQGMGIMSRSIRSVVTGTNGRNNT